MTQSETIRPGARRQRPAWNRARRQLGRAVLVACAAAVFGPVSPAIAALADVNITQPTNGSVIRIQTPSFSGTTDEFFEELEPLKPVSVKIYSGPAVGPGPPIQMLETTSLFEVWAVGPAAPLAPGMYTAQAVQEEVLEPSGGRKELGASDPVTFTIDTSPPQVTLTSPATGSSTTSSSQMVSGTAGTAAGDIQEVTAQLFTGPDISSAEPIEAVTVPVSGGSWSAILSGLGPGTYTARAQQRDNAGNVGQSAAVTFTVTSPQAPPAHAPPVASFTWFPSHPTVGETVTLLSSSTDESSPITAFAWALTSNSPLTPGKPVLTTSFSTPGNHPVRLQVTAADGLSSTVTATIPVSGPSLVLMQPFPIVRIAGLVRSFGVKLSVLTVQAPVGARITVSCRGRGCPMASQSRVAASSSKKRKAASVVVPFRRFQRSLRAGVVLEVRVFKSGRIGKYTRFVIRRGKLPTRVDECLGPAGIKPIACPSS